MKLLFLHGLGQTADSWQPVTSDLDGYNCQALELFEDGSLPDNLKHLQDKVMQAVEQSEEDVCLIGLSLGAMLALSMIEAESSQIKGIVSCAGQYQFVHNRAYKRQFLLFRLLPKGFFRRYGLDKTSMVTFYKSLSALDLSASLKKTALPIQLVCGAKDLPNLKVAKELQDLVPNASLTIIENAGHELNKEQPQTLANLIRGFVENIS